MLIDIVTLSRYEDSRMQHTLFQWTSMWKTQEPNNRPVCFVFKITIKWRKEKLEEAMKISPNFLFLLCSLPSFVSKKINLLVCIILWLWITMNHASHRHKNLWFLDVKVLCQTKWHAKEKSISHANIFATLLLKKTTINMSLNKNTLKNKNLLSNRQCSNTQHQVRKTKHVFQL